jgi:cellulose synthase/poly-beta-1,6-N-acetylglucosamine synthase-like glycosyltransferase
MAIFDADFLPRPDFLKKTIPHFPRPQNRRGANPLGTHQRRLFAHHQVAGATAQRTLYGRASRPHERRHLLQFNGTAGVWRRQTIEDAGGWEADTLTEDFDLSIRAQLKGWKIKFLENIGAPAELPVEMNSLKSQQFRWMKGGAETAKKMLPTVWKSPL